MMRDFKAWLEKNDTQIVAGITGAFLGGLAVAIFGPRVVMALLIVGIFYVILKH